MRRDATPRPIPAMKKKSPLPKRPLTRRDDSARELPRKKITPPAASRSNQPQRKLAVKSGATAHAFPIVGVGASAGGLEAFSALLKHLPTDTGMAFVLVQHLSPTQSGMLPELLASTTSLPVHEVTEGMPIEPNQVYVIPPNTTMVVEKGRLKLLPRAVSQGQLRSIDFFLQSLAADRKHDAIGVILSGTASDGTLGLEAIKAEGGITFAQDRTAKFDSMPRSAVTAGCVDFVLSPAQIASELARLAAHPFLTRSKGSARTEETEDVEAGADYKAILAILQAKTGTDFSVYKPATLQRRLRRRMLLGQFRDIAAYRAHVDRHPAEADALCADFHIGVTNFFRDPNAFAFLQQKIFPRLVKNHQGRPAHDTLRVWTLGCSTGQEAYSIAMCWMEFAAKTRTHLALQIFSTDVHLPYLDRARSGVYSQSLLQDVSEERLRRFFVEVEGGFRVSKPIRDICVFARQNALTDPPFSQIDLISCRNMLIYVRPELQQKIIPVLHFALKPGGVLFLGPAESVGSHSELFASLDPKLRFFVRKQGAALARLRAPGLSAVQVSSRAAPDAPAVPKLARPALETSSEADRLMLSRFAPVGVVINPELEVLQFRGATGTYLEASPGNASLHLLKMAREGLLAPLRTATRKAFKTNRSVREAGVVVLASGRSLSVGVEIIPLKQPVKAQRAFLVSFTPVVEPGSPAPQAVVSAKPAREPSKSVREAKLRRELAETRDHLQSVIEQQDAYNEELQSGNEEAQASNEELQSINEEMETAKEELQASNEEITTVNEELQTRNNQLAATNSDLSNLMASVNLAVVILDRELHIRRFTGQAEKTLNLSPSDVGRLIGEVKLDVRIPGLILCAARVIETVTPHEQEVQDKQGRWFALRMRPYISADNKVDGVVLMLLDVDELKHTQAQITATRDYAHNIVETIGDALLVLDRGLIVQSANRAFYELFRVGPQETEKRPIYTLGNGEWNIPELRRLLEEVLPENRQIHHFDIETNFPRVGPKILRLNARRIEQPGDGHALILLAIADVTEARSAEEAIRVSENRYRRLFEAANEGVLILSPQTHKIIDANPFLCDMLGYPHAELLGKELYEIGLLQDEKASRAAFEQLRSHGTLRYENLPLETKQGDRREVEVVANLYTENGHEAVQCSIRDITIRKLAEEVVRESEQRLRFMAESMPQKISSARPNGEVDYLNQQWVEFTGRTMEELQASGWKDVMHPDDLKKTAALWEVCLATGEPFEREHRLRRRDGVYRWHLTRARAMRDTAGEIIRWIGSDTDIDDQKRAEQKLDEAVVARTTELNTIIGELERFSYTMAHDLRGPLRVMQGYASILQSDHSARLDDMGKQFVGKIANAAERMHLLVTDVLAFTRLTHVKLSLEAVPLALLIRTIIEQYPVFKVVQIQVPASLPTVHANPAALSQAISNLLSNAVKFTPTGHAPEIVVSAEEDEEWVTLSVRDDGIGIAAVDHERIFKMLERGPDATAYEGTGIGLAIVRQAIGRMGGTVGVESQLGQGSRFWLKLKRFHEPVPLG